jgi:hypothetical protein
VAISERALALRDTTLRDKKAEIDALLVDAQAQKHRAATVEASAHERMRNVTLRQKELENQKAGLQAERAAIIADRAGLAVKAEQLTALQSNIDAERRKLDAEGEELQHQRNQIAQDRIIVKKQSSDALASLIEINTKKAQIDSDRTRLNAQRKIRASEQSLIHDFLENKVRFTFKNDKLFLEDQNCEYPLKIEGRDPSTQFQSIISLIISVRSMRNDVVMAGYKIRKIADEIEKLRPELKEEIDSHRSMILAATNISFRFADQKNQGPGV